MRRELFGSVIMADCIFLLFLNISLTSFHLRTFFIIMPKGGIANTPPPLQRRRRHPPSPLSLLLSRVLSFFFGGIFLHPPHPLSFPLARALVHSILSIQIVLGSEGVVIVNDSAVGEPTIAHLPGTYAMVVGKRRR